MGRLRKALRVTAVVVPCAFVTTAGAYRWRHRPDLPQHELLDLQARRVVLTGGTSGIGRAVLEALVARGAQVVVGCRDLERGEALCSSLSSAAGGRAVVLQLDLSQPSSVEAFADEVRRHCKDGVDIVVSAAAEIRREPDRAASGVDLTFATNHLGPQQLLAQLQPELLRRAAPERHARVVIVGSRLERRGHIDLEALEREGSPDPCPADKFDAMRNYAASKLANTLLALELHRRLGEDHVDVVVVSPGMVHTNLWGQFPAWYRTLTWPVRACFLRSPADAAQGVLYAVAAREAEGQGGSYLYDGRPLERSAQAADSVLAASLYETCQRLIATGPKDKRATE